MNRIPGRRGWRDSRSACSRSAAIAVFVGNFDAEQYTQQGHLGAFLTEVHPAFYGVPGARYEAACASGSVALDAASARIRGGDYEVAVVLGIEIMKTVSSSVGGDFLGTAYYEREAKGVQFPFPKLFGKLADVIVERAKGVGEKRIMDALAEISRINYANAKLNPLAQTRTWFMSETRERSRQSIQHGCGRKTLHCRLFPGN